MYGYVRPLKGELKVSEYEAFHAIYCALCHQLSRRGGFAARFVVNYDFTFLAMLLSHADKLECEKKRCPARLGRRRACVCADETLTQAADESLILAWWKLNDAIADTGFIRSIPARVARALLRPAYKKAASTQPSFAETVRDSIAALSALEWEQCASLDAAADKFAVILQAAADSESDEKRRRALRSLLYQLGRLIYLLDAADDLADDWRNGTYNPLIYRYELTDGTLTPEQRQQLRETLCQAQNRMAAAFALIEPSCWQPVLANIVYYGLPWAAESVLNGEWNKRKQDGRIHERSL